MHPAARDRARSLHVPWGSRLWPADYRSPHSGAPTSPVSRAPCGSYSQPPGQARSFCCFRPCSWSYLRSLGAATALRAPRWAHKGPTARSGALVTLQGSLPKASSGRGGRSLAGMPKAPACLALGPLRAWQVVLLGLRRPCRGRGVMGRGVKWCEYPPLVPGPPSTGGRKGPICHPAVPWTRYRLPDGLKSHPTPSHVLPLETSKPVRPGGRRAVIFQVRRAQRRKIMGH